MWNTWSVRKDRLLLTFFYAAAQVCVCKHINMYTCPEAHIYIYISGTEVRAYVASLPLENRYSDLHMHACIRVRRHLCIQVGDGHFFLMQRRDTDRHHKRTDLRIFVYAYIRSYTLKHKHILLSVQVNNAHPAHKPLSALHLYTCMCICVPASLRGACEGSGAR